MTRTISTAVARDAVNKIQAIVDGPLLLQLIELERQAQVLADPIMWDGRLAEELRSKWLERKRQLSTVRALIEELQREVDTINRNIMHAGGNA